MVVTGELDSGPADGCDWRVGLRAWITSKTRENISGSHGDRVTREPMNASEGSHRWL
jgi:hypothetical protein